MGYWQYYDTKTKKWKKAKDVTDEQVALLYAMKKAKIFGKPKVHYKYKK